MESNIYEYGMVNPQSGKNTLFKEYLMKKEKCEELSILCDSVGDTQKKLSSSKLIGVIVAEVFKEQFTMVLEKYGFDKQYKISENNVYIVGCPIEFDFLVLKKSAEKIENLPVYSLSDVIAVLESKTYGVYNLYKRGSDDLEKFDLYRFVKSYFTLDGPQNNIRLGYMCLSEQRPNNGNSNFIMKTLQFFEDIFKQYKYDISSCCYTYFSRCHFASKKEDYYSTDLDWERFVLNLVGKSNVIS